MYCHTHLYVHHSPSGETDGSVSCPRILQHIGGAGDLLNGEQPAESPEPQLPLNKSNTAAVWCSVKVFISRQNIRKKAVQ